MSEWTERGSGLLVPAFPHRVPMSSLPAGWKPPKPKNRIFTRPGQRPADPAPGSWSPKDLHTHVKGRADATARVLIGVAVLKQTGCILNYVVSSTGAVWQDWEGSGDESHRAHRIPCNPIICNTNIPDLARGEALRRALIEPLAETDYLPKSANYADSRFEALGAAESLENAVRLVCREQPRDRPPVYDLLRHAVDGVAIAGYRAAYEAVWNELETFIAEEDSMEFMERARTARAKAPKSIIEDVQDAVWDLRRYTAGSSASLLHPVAFQREADRLLALARQNQGSAKAT